MTLAGRRVLLGIGGGIAAYKGPLVVRELTRHGADVRVVVTSAAARFVSPLALQAVSHAPVGLDLFDPAYEAQIGHIELARWAEAVLVAPATANLLARIAGGFCDDLLTTVLCATTAEILVAPAMNSQMLANVAVAENLSLLASRGLTILDPDSGELACQEVGPGRMPDPWALREAVERALTPADLGDRRVLVTAGPTREALDPVRFLSNRSTGKMGFALAAAAARRGARVQLIAGPTTLQTPSFVQRTDVVSAADMAAAVDMALTSAPPDVIIKAAAVADYRPTTTEATKIPKGDDLTLPLSRTRDILASLGALPDAERPLLVGFAAETGDVEGKARAKLATKNLDLIVGNEVGGERSAFGSDDNEVVIVGRDGNASNVGPATKRVAAEAILDRVVELLDNDPRPT